MYEPNPSEKARDTIDAALVQCGWLIDDKNRVNLAAGLGIAAAAQYPTDTEPADYILFIDKKPVSEAKREEEGHRLTAVEEQSVEYAAAKLKYCINQPLPFVYESTGEVTRFTDSRDLVIDTDYAFPEQMVKIIESDSNQNPNEET